MKHHGTFDYAIVGGGPAGMAAAVTAAEYGMKTCVIDEQPRWGGQIYRQPPAEFSVGAWLPGATYAKGKALIAKAQSLTDVEHIAPATVWGCFPSELAGSGHDLLFHDDRTAGRVTARNLMIATGCYESPVAFPGWQLPGVMSAGAIQTLVKSQRVASGRSIVLAGSHPLLLVVAQQLLEERVTIAALIFIQPMRTAWRLARALPTAVIGARQLLTATACLAALRRAAVPVIYGHAVIEAQGARAVESVRIRNLSNGESRSIECDTLGICYGFTPSSELSRQCGAAHRWAPEGGWVTNTDAMMRSTVPGISVAGELIGVAGAEAAALSGEIAALAAAVDQNRVDHKHIRARLRTSQRRLKRLQRFAALLNAIAAPHSELLNGLKQRDTLICRCEDISATQIEDALHANPELVSASTVKLMTRAGMGFCQGRMCEISVRRIIADLRQIPLEQVPGFVTRPPIKPIPLALLASLPDALTIDPNTLGLSSAEQ